MPHATAGQAGTPGRLLFFFLELLPRQQIKLATRLASVIAPHPAGIVPLSGSQASAPCFFFN